MTTERAEPYRISVGLWSSKPGDSFGLFSIPALHGKWNLKVIVAPTDEEWQHVSVSLPNRCPTWSEMCKVKDLFWDSNEMVVQYHPEKQDYVNCHPYCLHLWRWTKGNFPKPPSILVGPQTNLQKEAP